MLIIIFSVAAFVIFLLSLDPSWGNVLSSKRNNLVFEGRIQTYGAYLHRKEHHKATLYAILCSIGITAGLLISFGVNKNRLSKEPSVPIPSGVIFIMPPITAEKKIEEKIKVRPLETTTQPASKEAGDREIQVVEKPVIISPPLPFAGNGGVEKGNGKSQPFEGAAVGTGMDGTEGSSSGLNFKAADYAAVMPEFPGGQAAMMKFMLERVKYGERDKELGVKGLLQIAFVVNLDGSITDIEVVRLLHNGENLQQKAIRAIEEMPKWSPGRNGNTPVRVRYVMPLRFDIRN